ncbi:TonB-linked SusC/RagA family outer membrane protein [Mucilaginibacter frigoritolerans]|uniref:TonB-linked SusC/RagA family outer membrane protein n=1 Tax=Mucilaginibacter frigoritolerans TaxID=652788 RepID=A0A562UFV9_9SPHI|nr:SusC/RagA family TonB-linked outer membrane protein [Mucilaginibacter frigoritolerans]TWJ04688.1 TonB-linked SusC/RagA family outer membrane protein [Mucilaginibacter frigoritolerans]
MKFYAINMAVSPLDGWPIIKKILLVMKLTTLLLIIALVQVSAKGFSQINLSEKNVPVEKVIKAIEKQTGYVFIYDEAKIKLGSVSVDLYNATINEALAQCFKNIPVTFQIIDKNIVLQPKVEEPNLFDKIKSIFSAIDVTGHILNEQGQPIAGATVTVKNINKTAITDATGRFEIKGVDEHAVIVITYLGYVKRELPAAADIGNIWMVVATNQLDAVQVIGYGETTKRLSTGNISTVSATEIEQQPVSNPILALEGRVPGMFITQNAGYAGANMTVSIRGQNSLTSGGPLYASSPLYVVDGIPFGSGPVEQSVGGYSSGGTTGLSPLNTINPDDIESISVLKDADATAIYGSRGANGVVLITTKKGKPGNTRVNVDISSGFGDVDHNVNMASTAQYLSIRKQAFANDNITPTTTNAPDLTVWNQTGNTDFGKLLIGQTSYQTKASMSVSGGDTYTQFLLGGNYRRESSVFYSKNADEAGQFNLSLQHKSHDGKFGVSASVNYNVDSNTLPNYSVSSANYSLPPNYPLYNSNGSLYFGTGYTNPLAGFNVINNLKTDNLIANTNFHYLILPGLDLAANMGYNRINAEGSSISPASANNPLTNAVQTSTLNDNYIETIIIEPQLNYTHTWGKGKLTALIGGTWQETQTIQPYFVVGSFANIELAKSLSALTVFVKSSGDTDYKYDSGFGRLAYEWDNKYLISGNLRRDGSSRFGADRQFGTFGSIAGAWIFSNESFAKDNLPWLSFGKIKTSYGTVGNDKITDYSYEATYYSQAAYGAVNGLTPSRIANPYLQWEVTKKLDAELELGFLQDRIYFSADFYRNRSSNLLGTTALPSQVGFGSYYANLPATVQNKGLELELTTVNFTKGSKFSWSTSFNLTLPNNKLIAFPNLSSSTFANTFVIGQSLNPILVYHFTGFQNGIATVQDLNHDGVITTGINANGKGDYVVDGSYDPKLYGGITNTFSYKRFQLDFTFQGVERDAQRGDLSLGVYPGRQYNIPQSLLDLPVKYSTTSSSAAGKAWFYYTNSDAAIQDASYIRLKNVSLAFNAPPSWSSRLKLSSLQLYLHGENLLTFTKYKGLDPETLGANLPPLRMIVAGIKTTF